MNISLRNQFFCNAAPFFFGLRPYLGGSDFVPGKRARNYDHATSPRTKQSPFFGQRIRPIFENIFKFFWIIPSHLTQGFRTHSQGILREAGPEIMHNRQIIVCTPSASGSLFVSSDKGRSGRRKVFCGRHGRTLCIIDKSSCALQAHPVDDL